MTAAIEPATERPTRVLRAVPVVRITTQARTVRFGRTLGTAVAGLFYLLGYGAARVLGAVWFGLVWCVTAVQVGWSDARKAPEAT